MPENFEMTTYTRADGSECCRISFKGQPAAALWVFTDLPAGEAPVLDICSVDQRDAAGVVSWSKTLHTVLLSPESKKEDNHATRQSA